MTRLEKCELAKQKGYTYEKESGKIFGVKGLEIKRKDNYGYIIINLGKGLNLKSHHYGWYIIYGNVDFDELDHKDTNPSNNRIDNLRITNSFQQKQNRKFKGCYFDGKKWRSQISINYKIIYLGRFDTEEEARNAYLEAKKIHHIV